MRSMPWDPVCRASQPTWSRPVRVDPDRERPDRLGSRRAVRTGGRPRRGCTCRARWTARVVEQRILEQGSRIPGYGAVTGWAALRWYGATYFDGVGYDGEPLPVPLILHDGIRPDPRFTQTESQLACTERMRGRRSARDDGAAGVVRRGTADPQRPRVGGGDQHGRGGTADLGAPVQDVRRSAQRWEGVPHARLASALARDDCRSPQEHRMVLVWVLDAGLDPPLVQPRGVRPGRPAHRGPRPAGRRGGPGRRVPG